MRASLSIIVAMNDPGLFEPWFPGPTWNARRVILKAAFGPPMAPKEISIFRSVADRDPPTEPVKELWTIVGRRSGKDSIASVIAAYVAALFEDSGSCDRASGRLSCAWQRTGTRRGSF
jgi:hypothetical protein